MSRVIRDLDVVRWGRVVEVDDVVPYRVLDADGSPIEVITGFLGSQVAKGARGSSVRSYAYALHRWWRFLVAVGIPWDRATSTEVRDFVLWMMSVPKGGGAKRAAGARPGGSVNPVTRKAYLDENFKPRTIRHSNAVLRSFYDYWLELGEGPLVNPVVRERAAGRRANAHHNPLEAFRNEGRLRYNPPVPRRAPRALPEERWNDLFARMTSNRDRAILAIAVSNGARAGELLGVAQHDIDWGEQLVRVRRKGTQAEQWLPASSDAFVWLRLYIADIGGILPEEGPIWLTLRRRTDVSGERARVPLTYDALRAVLRRANAALGANWSMHDLRHTAAIRMVRDERLSLRDVQSILGHTHITTTQIYVENDDEEVIARMHQHLAATANPVPPAPRPALGYDPADLQTLFGER